MKKMLRKVLFAGCVAAACQASAQVTFYQDDGFAGRSFSTNHTVPDLLSQGFDERASSAIVRSGSWEVCDDAGLRGRCVVLGPGDYPSLASVGLGTRISSVREVEPSPAYSDRGEYRAPLAESVPPSDSVPVIESVPPTAPTLTLFENDNFTGRSVTAENMIPNFARINYNDLASSATLRGGSWEVCTHENFEGHCVVLRPGDYPSLRAFGINRQISSAREVDRAAVAERPFVGDRLVSGSSDRYDYRANGWRYDRWTHQWERY